MSSIQNISNMIKLNVIPFLTLILLVFNIWPHDPDLGRSYHSHDHLNQWSVSHCTTSHGCECTSMSYEYTCIDILMTLHGLDPSSSKLTKKLLTIGKNKTCISLPDQNMKGKYKTRFCPWISKIYYKNSEYVCNLIHVHCTVGLNLIG